MRTAWREHNLTYDLITELCAKRGAPVARALCCPRMYVFVTRGTSILRARNTLATASARKKRRLCAQIEKVLWSGRLAAGGTRLPFSRTTLRPTPSSSNLHGAPPEVEQAPHAGTGRSPRSASRDS